MLRAAHCAPQFYLRSASLVPQADILRNAHFATNFFGAQSWPKLVWTMASRRSNTHARLAVVASSIFISYAISAAVPGFAQSSTNELSQYTAAVARVQRSDRVVQLEHFANHAKSGPLKVAALEFVIWEYLRTKNFSHALAWADDLQAIDPDNPVALAVLSNDARKKLQAGTTKPPRLLKMASDGLDALPQLFRPLGMSQSDFIELKRQANAMLSGAAGDAELRLHDYIAARIYFHNAVYVQPDNAAELYALALADLNGRDPNRREGYWYLARAVDLSKGTPQGIEIARFARAQYVKDGGSSSDWNQFLAAAASPNRKAALGTELASVKPPLSVPQPPTKVVRPSTVARSTPNVTPSVNPQPAPSVWADTENSMPTIVRKRRVPATVGPMSLGILVETSLANKENRSAVVNSLVDMLRRMNDRDEAFVLTYDNNLVFAQDLTNDPQQLEQALESIKPQKGAVLDDAVAFAAGHLARIAKYPNRVLLVVSDGRNIDSHSSPTQTSVEINAAGVRIFCIGVDVSESYGRYRLQLLSQSTGGEASFISDPSQFRRATQLMAQNLGIEFKF